MGEREDREEVEALGIAAWSWVKHMLPTAMTLVQGMRDSDPLLVWESSDTIATHMDGLSGAELRARLVVCLSLLGEMGIDPANAGLLEGES